MPIRPGRELAPSSTSALDRAFLVASARETFEEAGLMLARRGGGADMVGADEAHRLVETYRARLVAGETTFLDLVRNEGLRLAADLMVPFAHWITPETQPKRFDTHFLLVSAPVEQLGAHDGARIGRRLLDRAARRPCATRKRARARCCSPRI